MSGKSLPTTTTRWVDLPDPSRAAGPAAVRSTVITIKTWRHIIGKHIRRRSEPWDEILCENSLEVLQQADITDDAAFVAAVQAASDALGRQARESLSRPLVLSYLLRCPPGTDSPPGRHWLLVLPRGAVACIKSRKRDSKLLTAFFYRDYSRSHHRYNRWKYVLFFLRNKYTRRDPVTGQRIPPPESHEVVVPRDHRDEIRTDIRFHSEENWFLPGPGRIPAGELPQWSEAPPTMPPAHRPDWMKPPEDSEHDHER